VNPELMQTMKHSVVRASRAAVVVAVPVAFSACTWFTDFKNQPRLEPWESFAVSVNDTMAPPRFNPQQSVPVQGMLVSGFAVSYTPAPAVLDSMAALRNPVAVDERSLDNGRKYYSINCAVCHGDLGDGNGGMKSAGYAFYPSIIADGTKARSDGYFWAIIRNGRGLMPGYARIEEADRWDVVNYVRALQGLTSIKPVIGPHGAPGQNGTTVPRASATAPQLPAPFAAPSVVLTPGSSGKNAATTGREKASFPNGAPMSGGGSHDGGHDGADAAQEIFQ